jgi:carbonic anhydrase
MLDDEQARHRLLVELNVVEQCLNIHKTAVVQRKRMESFKAGAPFVYPRVHAMVFDPSVGVLNKLRVSFKKQLEEFSHIYNVVPDYTNKVDDNE